MSTEVAAKRPRPAFVMARMGFSGVLAPGGLGVPWEGIGRRLLLMAGGWTRRRWLPVGLGVPLGGKREETFLGGDGSDGVQRHWLPCGLGVPSLGVQRGRGQRSGWRGAAGDSKASWLPAGLGGRRRGLWGSQRCGVGAVQGDRTGGVVSGSSHEAPPLPGTPLPTPCQWPTTQPVRSSPRITCPSPRRTAT